MKIKFTIYITLLFFTVVGQEKENKLKEDLQAIIAKTVDNQKVFGVSFAVQKDSFNWEGTAGNIAINHTFFIASTCKIFASAIVFYLINNDKINLKDKISKYLDANTLNQLHVYKGKDYSNEITLEHLLAHTSGLPDYFQDKDANGESLEKKLTAGKDMGWDFEYTIALTKKLTPHFAPGTKNKAHYSDANYQILGKIIEVVTGKSFAQNCNEIIINPLQLNNTYLFPQANKEQPKTLYYKNKPLEIPLAMASFGADGGIVSNSADMMIFIRAFFNGEILNNKKYLRDLSKGNQKKVGIIATLIGNPEVVVLDEPFANLDPTTVNRLKKIIKELSENPQVTILVSSHDLQHTVEVCDRIVALNKGEVVKDIVTSAETLQELEAFFAV